VICQDSAFIALGKSYYNQSEAQEELLTLFNAQWTNGMVPHIVFNPNAPSYFPGSDWWQSQESSIFAPRSVKTSGIIQPPVHAIGALKIYENAADREAALSFLRSIFQPLVRWHAYLYEERQWKSGLVWVRHPWESGMDNSPLWDEAMANIVLTPEMVPSYNRSDDKIVNATDRPTKFQYDRFVWLVEQARNVNYSESAVAHMDKNNFLVVDVLFNAILVRAGKDLAKIAEILEEDATLLRKWAQRTADGLQSILWDSRLGCYRNYDMLKGGLTAPELSVSVSAFSPLFAAVPTARQVEQMLTVLDSTHFASAAEANSRKVWPLVTFDRQNPLYNSHNYWRGPVWVNTNWIIYKGLRQYTSDPLVGERAGAYAAVVKNATIGVVLKTGLWEYFDAVDSSGHGTDAFSWTAALIIDLLNEGDEKR